MGTILNTSRAARKKIKEAEQAIKNAKAWTNINGSPFGWKKDNKIIAREKCIFALAKIEDVLGQLDKNSPKIKEYELYKSQFESFLKTTENKS